jgi:hypothetical protein
MTITPTTANGTMANAATGVRRTRASAFASCAASLWRAELSASNRSGFEFSRGLPRIGLRGGSVRRCVRCTDTG